MDDPGATTFRAVDPSGTLGLGGKAGVTLENTASQDLGVAYGRSASVVKLCSQVLGASSTCILALSFRGGR